ncbi:HsdR family type I site-specific deoxyribonuclease [Mesorhizobium sp. M1066]|uniref:type I restriction endonuclease subunit R n=1 Tax=unclassified Mesorhizobium TaxID=325217 RepID=UPI0033369092
MNDSPAFALSEAGGAQLAALATLSSLGWHYVPRAQADRLRSGRRSEVFLNDILRSQLARLNNITWRERRHLFSEANIETAIRRLSGVRYDGVLRTNEVVTDLLQLGIALPQTIDDTAREWPFRYIDWDDWRANAFHMTAEYPVEWPGGGSIRPDLVLFVNGIPFAVIEVKSSREKTEQGITQTIRNQKADVGCPNLFFSVQLVLAANPHEPRYATVGTPLKFWSSWREREDAPDFSRKVVARSLDSIEAKHIFDDFAPHRRRFQALAEQGRESTRLDETLVALFRPERLLDMARRFTLFDGPVKKVARHQQVFAINSVLGRVQKLENGRRAGGVVWHTQGSGKSLTMVMLARTLTAAVKGARLVLVTDRTDLDDQIARTFAATGLAPQRARTGEHLIELIEERARVITTVIHKFRAALGKRRVVDRSSDIFVLVDESHRSQYGDLESLHARMREVFPQACFIGFTGTPIAKRERNTFRQFGPLFDPVYSMRDAVGDGAVVPLLYEGRHVEEDVDEQAIDIWFDRVTRGLSSAQANDLKRKMSRPRAIAGVASRLKCIAFDVSQHFTENFKGSGLKGQLVAPSKRDAIILKRLIDEFGEISAEVIISAPDQREGDTDIDEEVDDDVVAFWRRMMARYRGEETYNKGIIDAFKGPGDPDLLIVVDKLLTGFDAPRNTVLYLAKPLKEHGLLQAIARVNRIFDEDGAPPKPFGYIIDYCGVLRNLGDALSANDALAAFDDEDLAKALTDVADEARRLPSLHAALLDLFSGVANRFDEEAYAKALIDEALREEFYRRLGQFSRCLTVALSSRTFQEETPPERLQRWRTDEKRFVALREHVRARYAEKVDWSDYEHRVRTLLDQHVTAHEVITVVEPLNVFDEGAIEAARAGKTRSDASIADEIAHRALQVIEEKWEQDPVFFEKFSKLIRDAIDAFRRGRLEEKAYLAEVRRLRDSAERREDADDPTPEAIRGKSHETAFWGIARRELAKAGFDRDGVAVDIAEAVTRIVAQHRVIGWQSDRDTENRIRNDIDDFFFDEVIGRRKLAVDPAVLDAIMDDVIASARVRMADDGRIH